MAEFPKKYISELQTGDYFKTGDQVFFVYETGPNNDDFKKAVSLTPPFRLLKGFSDEIANDLGSETVETFSDLFIEAAARDNDSQIVKQWRRYLKL